MDDHGRAGPPDVVGEPDLPVHLPGSRLSPELLDHLADLLYTGRTDGVPACLQAAARVHREVPVKGGNSILGEPPRLPLFTEAEVLDGTDLGDGEAVVHLEEIDLRHRDTGQGKGTPAGEHRRVQGGDVPAVVEGDG